MPEVGTIDPIDSATLMCLLQQEILAFRALRSIQLSSFCDTDWSTNQCGLAGAKSRRVCWFKGEFFIEPNESAPVDARLLPMPLSIAGRFSAPTLILKRMTI